MSIWHLLAQTSRPVGRSAGGSDAFFSFWLPMILMGVVFYWIVFRGQRKERQQQRDMLGNLKRNDRVQTIGGVLGTVVDVRENEVVLKVDETSNVKMRFNRSAVKEVLSDTPEKK